MSLRPHSQRRRPLVAAVIVLGLTIAGLCVWRQIDRRPRLNLLLVTLDTTRADRIGCYGYPEALTPALDKLARSGVLLEQAYTTVPLTLPAHASLFSGLYPPEHGIHTNGKNRLDDDIPTLAEACRASGCETAAFIASFVLDSKFGLDRGFQTYDDDLTGTVPADEALHRNRAGDQVVDQALKWLGGRIQQPFFCWVHLYDPHSPYLDHADRYGDRFQDRPYDAEIAFVDEQLARLVNFVESQGLAQQTLIVVIGDHGEGLNQHAERRHGQMLYDSTLHVPWIMSLPGMLPAERRIATPVSLVDFYPTVIDALQLKGSAKISGRSLLAAARGEPLASRPLYAETDEPWLESGWSPLRALIADNWKYIRTPKGELFDRTEDSLELNNLAAQFPVKIEEFERQLSDLESGFRLRTGSEVKLTDAERKKLAGLGYVGHAGADFRTSIAELRDIKEMVEHHNALEDAREALDAGRYDEAIDRLQSIVAAAPDYELAELALGDVHLRQQRYDEAWEVYHRVAQRNPESALAILHLGDVREAQGRFDEALGFYREALQRQPDFARLHYNIGRMLVVLRQDEDAMSHFKTAIELDPGFVFAHVELGSALSRRGLTESALAEYELALTYDARSVFAHMNAANVLARTGRQAEALAHLEEAAAIAPDDAEVLFQLGAFLAQIRQTDRAVPHLEAALRINAAHDAAARLLSEIREKKN